MGHDGAAGFWSYTHDDDKHEDGAIVRLATRIGEEYSLITGEELTVFVDRKDLAWGEHWKKRIDNALVSTTFFIPVVTPRYFVREECRRELFEFARHAKALGVSELICPILYVPVGELEEDNSDEAVALVARAQYEDWTSLRLCDERSAEHRRAVNRLATRLAEVADKVGSRQAEEENELNEEDEKAGLSETLDEIRELLPEWVEAVEADGLVREQFLATDSMLEERKRKLKIGPAGARYAIFRQQVAEYMPLVDRRTEIAQLVLRKTVQLGPLVARAIRISGAHPEDDAPLQELAGAFQRAGQAYKRWDQPMEPVAAWARRNADKTRGMLKLARAAERGDSIRKEIGAGMEVWGEELRVLKSKLELANSDGVITALAAVDDMADGEGESV
jgi:TIR domain